MHRPVRDRGRGADHGSARAEPAGRTRARCDAVEVGDAAVLDRADLRSRHRPDGGQATGPGTDRDDGPHSAELGCTAGDHPTSLGDQPGDEDRHVLRRGLHDRHVDDGLLEGASPATGSARRRQRGDLGSTTADAVRQRGPGPAARERGHARTGDDGDGRRARRRPAQVLQRDPGRHRGCRGDAQPEAGRSAHPADRDRTRPEGGRRRQVTVGRRDPARRHRPRVRKASSRSAATPSSTTARA